MRTVLWFPVAALNSALRACERRPWRQWWMRGERKTRERSSTAPRPLGLCRHSCTPRGSLKTSRLQQEFAPSQPQWRSRCMGKKDTSFRGPCVQKQPVAVPCFLCSRRANYPSFCSSVEQFMPQPHALNTSPSKAGSEWLSHIFA